MGKSSDPSANYTMPPGIAGVKLHATLPLANNTNVLDVSFGRFIGTSPAMCTLYQKIESAAARDVPIFLTGELGTGKGTCAEALHKHGKHPDKSFIVFNCQSVPHHLTHAALFGEHGGAITRARGGTLFLDDITEMESVSQGELLHFILNGHLEAAGVRLICATARPVTSAIESGLLREDLFNYLHVLGITLPPLRSRGRDILDIAHLWLCQAAQRTGKFFQNMDDGAEEILLHHDWPGNLRQLRNVIEQLITRYDEPVITIEMLQGLLPRPTIKDKAAPAPASPMPTHTTVSIHPAEAILFGSNSLIQPFAMVERALIERAIHLCAGNIPKAAAKLGLSPSTIYRKKSRMGRTGWHRFGLKPAFGLVFRAISPYFPGNPFG